MCYDRSEASENVYMRAFKIKAVKARNIQLFEQVQNSEHDHPVSRLKIQCFFGV